MIAACQRWRERRDSYRPAGETIATHAHEVAPIADDSTAKAFVVRHHYSASYPAARFRVGLYRRGELAGVAVFSQPSSQGVLNALPCGVEGGVALGRFVLLDEVEANGETWFLARAFQLAAREGFAGVVSDSDPEPRTTAEGRVAFGGHIGTIYQASNAVYLGRTPRRTRRVPGPRSARRSAGGATSWSSSSATARPHPAPIPRPRSSAPGRPSGCRA